MNKKFRLSVFLLLHSAVITFCQEEKKNTRSIDLVVSTITEHKKEVIAAVGTTVLFLGGLYYLNVPGSQATSDVNEDVLDDDSFDILDEIDDVNVDIHDEEDPQEEKQLDDNKELLEGEEGISEESKSLELWEGIVSVSENIKSSTERNFSRFCKYLQTDEVREKAYQMQNWGYPLEESKSTKVIDLHPEIKETLEDALAESLYQSYRLYKFIDANIFGNAKKGGKELVHIAKESIDRIKSFDIEQFLYQLKKSSKASKKKRRSKKSKRR